MTQLTIFTHRYNQQLEGFIGHATQAGALNIRKMGRKNNIFFANCLVKHTTPVLVDAMLALLIDIALYENPIYRRSEKLRKLAGDLYGTPLYTKLHKDLKQFINHNKNLHLEGYMAFRMTEYREKLDMMSYSLIKKMKLSQQD